MIHHAEPLQKFTPRQVADFLKAIEQGHDDTVSAVKASVPLTGLTDFMIQLDSQKYAEAKARSLLPLAQVKERMNVIMENANDPEDPMPPALAIEILKRKDSANWGDKQTFQVEARDTKLSVEEQLRLQAVFSLPTAEVESLPEPEKK